MSICSLSPSLLSPKSIKLNEDSSPIPIQIKSSSLKFRPTKVQFLEFQLKHPQWTKKEQVARLCHIPQAVKPYLGYQDHCFILKFVVYYMFLMRIFVEVYCIFVDYHVSCILFIKKNPKKKRKNFRKRKRKEISKKKFKKKKKHKKKKTKNKKKTKKNKKKKREKKREKIFQKKKKFFWTKGHWAFKLFQFIFKKKIFFSNLFLKPFLFFQRLQDFSIASLSKTPNFFQKPYFQENTR